MFRTHSPWLAAKGCLAGMTWRLGEGQSPALPPHWAHRSLPICKEPPTHTGICTAQNTIVQRNTLSNCSDSAKMGRYLDNHTAERTMSITRNNTWHLLPYERRKSSHVILGSLNVSTMTHWENNQLYSCTEDKHMHMLWQTLFE